MNPIDASTSKSVITTPLVRTSQTTTSQHTSTAAVDSTKAQGESSTKDTKAKSDATKTDDQKSRLKDIQKLQNLIADGAYTIDLGKLATAMIKKQTLN